MSRLQQYQRWLSIGTLTDVALLFAFVHFDLNAMAGIAFLLLAIALPVLLVVRIRARRERQRLAQQPRARHPFVTASIAAVVIALFGFFGNMAMSGQRRFKVRPVIVDVILDVNRGVPAHGAATALASFQARHVRGIALEPDGRLKVVMTGMPEIEGKMLWLVRVESSSDGWKCQRSDMDPMYLPPDCM